MGGVAFELILVLTPCASETRSKNVSERALHGGVEVAWKGFKWLRCVLGTAGSINCRVEAGIERQVHFSGALKRAGDGPSG